MAARKSKTVAARKSKPVPAPSLSADERKWRAKDAASTLIRAEEIKADKALHRMATTEIRKQAQAANKALKGK